MAGTDSLRWNNLSATDAGQIWKGGKMQFMVEATFGGGTVKLQAESTHGTWIDVPNASFTAQGMVALDLSPGMYRVNIATATAVFASGTLIPYNR